MPIDITSETVTMQNGMITLQGTGTPGDTIDIFVNGVGPKVSAVVDINGVWTTAPFNPGAPAGEISVKATVRGDPTQDHVESIIVKPEQFLALLNSPAVQAALSGKGRRAKPVYAVTIHRGTPPKATPTPKPKPKKPASPKPAAKKPAAKKPAAKPKPKK